MLYHEQSDDYRPLFWVQGHPVYSNTLIVAVQVAAFVVSAICVSFLGFDPVVDALALNTHAIWSGEVWRLFSYIAFSFGFFSQGGPFYFLFSIILLYFFGREVEQFVGRRTYLKVYAAIILVPSILLSLAGLVTVPSPYLQCGDVIFGVFVAFATIYPGATPSMWVPLTARALMWILLGLYTLIYLATHNFTAIFMLWACSAVGYTGMRLIGGGRSSSWFANWLEERRMQRLTRQHQFKIVQEKKTTQSIDAILDKISKQGVGSLDASERAALENARTKLLKRDER